MINLADLPHANLAQIMRMLDLRSLVFFGNTSTQMRTVAEDLIRRLFQENGWNAPGESPMLEFLEIMAKQIHLVTGLAAKDQSCNVAAFTNIHAVDQTSFGRDFKVVLTHYGSVFSDIGHQEADKLVQVSTPHKIRSLTAGEGAMVLLTIDHQAFYMTDATNYVQIEVEGVQHVSMCRGSAVVATEGTVFVYDPTDQLRELRVEGELDAPIIDVQAGPRLILVLLQNGKLFSSDPASLCLVYSLLHKPIGLMSCGTHQSVVLVRRQLPEIAMWTPDQIHEWFVANGFEDCCQILRYQSITGAQLLAASDEYMLDTLGIREIERRRKLMLLIQQCEHGHNMEQGTLWGWGSNQRHQLGAHDNLVKKPTKMPDIPLNPDEHITKLASGAHRTFVLTTEHRVLAIGNGVATWTDMTPTLTNNAEFGIFDIAAGYVEVAIIVNKIIRLDETGRDKMRPGSKILAYLKRVGQLGEYVVGYEDRFLGILEIQAQEFIDSDFPPHRLRYFKRHGKIVWDRKTKLDAL